MKMVTIIYHEITNSGSGSQEGEYALRVVLTLALIMECGLCV